MVKDIWTVRRRQDDHVRVAVEPVHFDEDLIQRLLALVVAPAQAGAALSTYRVDLINEDDAGSVPLRLLE